MIINVVCEPVDVVIDMYERIVHADLFCLFGFHVFVETLVSDRPGKDEQVDLSLYPVGVGFDDSFDFGPKFLPDKMRCSYDRSENRRGEQDVVPHVDCPFAVDHCPLSDHGSTPFCNPVVNVAARARSRLGHPVVAVRQPLSELHAPDVFESES